MIILKSEKINIFDEKTSINCNFDKKIKQMKENIEKYENTIWFGYLECPNCNSDHLIGHGTYERNLIIKDICIKISIKRVKCKKCKSTHAIIPTFLKPYFQFESSFIDFTVILKKVKEEKNKIIESMLGLSRQLLRKWIKRFEMHEIRLKTLYKTSNINQIISKLFISTFIYEYITRYSGIRECYYFQKIM